MEFEKLYGHLHSNQKLLIKELISRGIKVEVLDANLELIRAEYNNHRELILDRDSSIVPYAVSVLAGDKFITKNLLKSEGLSVPLGLQFGLEDENAIIEGFNTFTNFNKTVVIKPVFGSHGYDVYINLSNIEDVKRAVNNIKEHRGINTKIVMEEYFEGDEYRVFITKEGNYAVLYREPAHVIGNGLNTIKELAEKETDKRMHPRKNALCPILLDEEVNLFLNNKGINLNTIPKVNEKIYLRANSNVAMGGLCIDYTDLVDPSVIKNCMQVFKALPGLPYIGVDYMSKDITAYQTNDMYNIIEVNTVPGIHMHMQPAIGKSRNVAKYMVDMMYPETKEFNNDKKFVRQF